MSLWDAIAAVPASLWEFVSNPFLTFAAGTVIAALSAMLLIVSMVMLADGEPPYWWVWLALLAGVWLGVALIAYGIKNAAIR